MRKIIIYIILVVVTLSICISVLSTNNYWESKGLVMDLREDIEAENNGSDTKDNVSNDTITKENESTDKINYSQYFSSVNSDLELLKSGDSTTVKKYFGESDIFTPENIADRVSTTTITDLSTEDSLIVHVCTLDYTKMNSDYILATEELNSSDDAKKEITRSLIEGDYKICYNIPLEIVDSSVVMSEAFKTAITGGWYNPSNIELSPIECIIEGE